MQVRLSENAKELLIPASAVTVETDIAKHAGHLQLTSAQVEAFLAFKPTARICDLGKTIRFESSSSGPAPSLGFDLCINCHFLPGRVMQTHCGFTVGDRVVVNKAYARYTHFAIGHGAIIRKIQMKTFALYFVEFEEEDRVRQVRDAHKIRGQLLDGQDPALMPCQFFHISHAAFPSVTESRRREYLDSHEADEAGGPAKKQKP